MFIGPNRRLTTDARNFNDNCELRFEEGALYEFPSEIGARSISSRLGDSGTKRSRPIKFREAIFLYSRVHHHWRTGTTQGRDYLFMVRSRRSVFIVPLTFADEVELPKRVSFFRKPSWWVTWVRFLTASKVCHALRQDETYEWPGTKSAPSFTSELDPMTGRPTDPKVVRFNRGTYLGFMLEVNEFLFRVEVLGQDQKTVVGRTNVAVRILDRRDLPRPVVQVENR